MTATQPVLDASDDHTISTNPVSKPSRRRRIAAGVGTTLAVLLIWLALVLPNDVAQVSLGALVRIPLEGILLVALLLVLPRRAKGPAAIVIGVLLALLLIVKVFDMGFLVAFGRLSNPAFDWVYAGSAIDLLSLSIGRTQATLAVVAALLLIGALLVAMPWAVLRLARLTERHRVGTIRAAGALGVVWIAFALLGLMLPSAAPVASSSAARLTYEHVGQVSAGIRDQATFAEEAAVDPFRQVPADQLLTALRGKDVIVAFVESYGRVAVEGSDFSSGVTAVLDEGTTKLRDAGFSSRSAFLTSPTFGGLSWLAHSTLQSGLWIDSQQRYDQLVDTDRLTLSGAFKRAGWRTVADVPSNEQDWSQGTAFYDYDTIYDARNVGYRGPTFSYASMPDQYVLSAFHRNELAQPGHAPVMAEIDLVSSHTPWTPLPRAVDWSAVGDGSVFRGMQFLGPSPDLLWRNADNVRTSYGASIQYTLSTLVSFVQEYGDDNLVLIVLGDHQPATIVSGPGASHDVPITIISKDAGVMDRVASWGWTAGMRPDSATPVERMDSFRNRFLSTFVQ